MTYDKIKEYKGQEVILKAGSRDYNLHCVIVKTDTVHSDIVMKEGQYKNCVVTLGNIDIQKIQII